MRKFSLIAAALLLAVPALAAPAEVAKTIRAKAPYGEATASALFIKAYTATLWTDAPRWSMAKPFALTIRYDMNFDSDEIVECTVKEMEHVNPAFQPSAAMTASLTRSFPAVKSGDRVTALHLPGKPVMFYKNGVRTGQIAGAGFARDFFGIWLSPNTSDAGMRKSLLRL
jgi:hypothetical protein